jgi:hypothetical protein
MDYLVVLTCHVTRVIWEASPVGNVTARLKTSWYRNDAETSSSLEFPLFVWQCAASRPSNISGVAVGSGHFVAEVVELRFLVQWSFRRAATVAVTNQATGATCLAALFADAGTARLVNSTPVPQRHVLRHNAAALRMTESRYVSVRDNSLFIYL